MESSYSVLTKREREAVKKSAELEAIVLEGGPDWRDQFSEVLESLDDETLENTLTHFIKKIVRNRFFGFETFVEIYEITSAEIWQNQNVYLPWIEVVSKYGNQEMFQIMSEDVNSEELWFALLVFGEAYKIGSERLDEVIDWMEEGGHDLEEILEDYIDQLNDGYISENDYDVAIILALCTHLGLDVASQPWVSNGKKVAQRISPFLEGV